MATNIVGTFPILNRQKSQTDEYDFDYITYEYTLKTETVDIYIPKKDDVFNGNVVSSGGYKGIAEIPAVDESSYVVENVEVTPLNGGLSTLTVQVVGTRNPIESATPKVFIRQGGPLIFGLGGSSAIDLNGEKAYAGIGQEIEVKFLALGGSGGENSVYQKYFSRVMPREFRGVSLPLPKKDPGTYTSLVSNNPLPPQPSILNGYLISYYGFTCKRVITERRGGLLLASLFFSESGNATLYGPSDTGGRRTTVIYNYPPYGG
jgi:hypothetical protein